METISYIMQTNRLIVIDTCALLPNCERKNDLFFDINKWGFFLKKDNQLPLCITPFTLYEVLSIKDSKAKNNLLKYLVCNKFEVLSYRKFPGFIYKQISQGNEWIPHLKKLIVYECNRLLEVLVVDFILSNKDIDFNPSNSDTIMEDLNDFRIIDDLAGTIEDLKTWFDKDYFSMFFDRVAASLLKNTGFHISSNDLMECWLSKADSLYGNYSYSDITSEDRFLSRYILKMACRKQRKHQMINYVIDVLNLHSVFQKELNAYFVTRDKETIKLFFEAEKVHIIDDIDKVNFLRNFLFRRPI